MYFSLVNLSKLVSKKRTFQCNTIWFKINAMLKKTAINSFCCYRNRTTVTTKRKFRTGLKTILKKFPLKSFIFYI